MTTISTALPSQLVCFSVASEVPCDGWSSPGTKFGQVRQRLATLPDCFSYLMSLLFRRFVGTGFLYKKRGSPGRKRIMSNDLIRYSCAQTGSAEPGRKPVFLPGSANTQKHLFTGFRSAKDGSENDTRKRTVSVIPFLFLFLNSVKLHCVNTAGEKGGKKER